MVRTRCPKADCGAKLEVVDQALGKKVKCPNCGDIFILASADVSPPSTLTPETPPAPSLPRFAARRLPTLRPPGRFPTEGEVPELWVPGDQILDAYIVKEYSPGVPFAKGGMGRVYRVHHENWKLDVAVKSPLARILSRPEKINDFEREAETWVNLDLHPNIATCHYVRRLGGIPRIFAEYVEGGTLADWIRSGRLYDGKSNEVLGRVLDIAIQVAWGLDYVHKQEPPLMHLDLKPQNVLMTPTGVAKVTDLGLAAACGVFRTLPQRGTGPTKGAVVCTQAYASPEQIAGCVLSRQTDIWSWGVSVLHMFTRTLPPHFVGSAAMEFFESYLKSEKEELIVPMPAKVAALLRQCFQKDPKRRSSSLKSVAVDLREIYGQVTGSSYARESPWPLERHADSLVNRAVSLLDLGAHEKAENLLKRALLINPSHREATYNLGLIRWRRGELRDLDLIAQVRRAGGKEAQVSSTAALLKEIENERADSAGAVAAWSDKAFHLPLRGDNEMRPVEGHEGSVTSLCFGQKGPVECSTGDRSLPSGDYKAPWALCNVSDPVAEIYNEAVAHFHACHRRGDYRSAFHQLALARSYTELSSHPELLTLWQKLYPSVVREKLRDGWLSRTLRFHRVAVRCLCLSADGRFALSGGEDGAVVVWDLATGCPRPISEAHQGAVKSVCLSGDGRRALSAGVDSTVKLWEVTSGRLLRTLTTERLSPACSVSLNHNGSLALSGHSLGGPYLWDLRSGECLADLKGDRSLASPVCLSPDGRLAVAGGYHGAVTLWDLSTGASQKTFAKPISKDPLRNRRLTMREIKRLTKRLSDEIEATTARIKDILGGRRDQALRDAGTTDQAQVTVVCLSPDGRLVLSGSKDSTIRLWEVVSGQRVCSLRPHGGLTSVCLSADSRCALAGGEVGTIALWDLERKEQAWTATGHKGGVTSVCLSPDGRFALSSGNDATVKVWSLDWELSVREPQDWEEEARPHLEQFLATCVAVDLGRGEPKQEAGQVKCMIPWRGRPAWTEDDFNDLLFRLGCAGFGSLRPEGVRQELLKMSGSWKPPRRWFSKPLR
jgi:WD40 repeat protein/serine/threonine protein kinase